MRDNITQYRQHITHRRIRKNLFLNFIPNKFISGEKYNRIYKNSKSVIEFFLYFVSTSSALKTHNKDIHIIEITKMHEDQKPPRPPKYADSSISDKAFKRMILWFFLYCSLFCVGVIVAVGADRGFFF